MVWTNLVDSIDFFRAYGCYMKSLHEYQAVCTQKCSKTKHGENESPSNECHVETEPVGNTINSVEEETNEHECLGMNFDEPVEEGHHIFVCECCRKILSRNNMRSHEFNSRVTFYMCV